MNEILTPETDDFVEYMNTQFPATVGHIPMREKVAYLERRLHIANAECERLRGENEQQSLRIQTVKNYAENMKLSLTQWRDMANEQN